MIKQTPKRKSITLKIGIVLLILGTLLWLSVLLFPFLPLSVGARVAGGAATAIIAKTVSWIGTFCIGKEVVMKYRHYLHPKNWKKSAKAKKVNE